MANTAANMVAGFEKTPASQTKLVTKDLVKLDAKDCQQSTSPDALNRHVAGFAAS